MKETDMLNKVIGFALAAVVAMLAVAAMFLPGFATAQSQTLTWKFQSFDHKPVDIQFYADNRTHLLPNTRATYSIDERGMHSYTIPCMAGEKICYGAWVRGNATAYWGKGQDDKRRCSDCCYTCNGGATPTRRLSENAAQQDTSHLFHFY
jgi:hypothetical protein